MSWIPGQSTMLFLPPKKASFRCECGCNVFTALENENTYKCNGCPATWRGLPVEEKENAA